MAEQTKIEIPITSEGVLGLRGACAVIKEAYKQSAAKQILQDENAILALSAEQLKGLKSDLIAAKGTIDSYFKLTLDDKREPTNSDVSSYSAINNITGNYPITDGLNQEIKKEVNSIIGNSGKYSLGSKKEKQSDFNTDPFKDYFQQQIERTTQVYGTEGINLAEGVTPYVPENEYAKKYEGSPDGGFLRDCLLCDTRKFNLDQITPMKDLLAIFENDLINKYRAILSQFRDLVTNTEVAEDLCSLINFLNFQCLPDLFGIVSLFQMMVLKLTDATFINPTGAFMSMLTPFFSPILNGVNELLDKYIQLILGPIDCVIDAVDEQLAKLDVGRALDQGRRSKLNVLINQRNALERKSNSLKDRKNFLQEQESGVYKNEPTAYKIETLDQQSNLANLNGNRVTRLEEIAAIDQDLDEIGDKTSGQIAALNAQIEEYRKSQPRSNLISGAGKGRKELQKFRNTLGKSLEDMKLYLVRGKNMINDTAKSLQQELTRLITGRAATSEEMLQGAMELQRLARMIGVVQTLIRLAGDGKLCENGNDPSEALGNFLSAGGQNPTGTQYLRGSDQFGEPVLLVASSDAEYQIASPEDREPNVRRDGEETSRLNRQGVVPDIGSVANKKISAVSSGLGVEVPVAVVKFNLCGDISASTSETIDNIKTWASSLR